MEVVVADMEHILRYKMEKSFKDIEEGLSEEQRQKKIEDKKSNKKTAASSSSLSKLGQIMNMKSKLLKQIEEQVERQKKATANGKDSTTDRKSQRA